MTTTAPETNGAREQRVIVLTVWKVGGAVLGVLVAGVTATWLVSNALWDVRIQMAASHTEIAELRLQMNTGFDQVRGASDDRWRKHDMQQLLLLIKALNPTISLPELR